MFASSIAAYNHSEFPSGLVLNGGIGVASKVFGPASDHILELTVVVADGSVVSCKFQPTYCCQPASGQWLTRLPLWPEYTGSLESRGPLHATCYTLLKCWTCSLCHDSPDEHVLVHIRCRPNVIYAASGCAACHQQGLAS